MADTPFTARDEDRVIERGTKFLSAASQVQSIRSLLEQGGYSEAEHQRGWELLLGALGYRRSPGGTTETDPAQARQREAMAALDQWDGPSFDRTRAALEHRYPAQAAYVFSGLSAKSGAESIGAVATFLDRVVALREGSDPARAASRADDQAAWQLLVARRIIDANEEQRLRALIAEATRLADLPPSSPVDAPAREKTLRSLDAWLRDWRESARVLVTRRDYQIRMGLADRRVSKDDASADA